MKFHSTAIKNAYVVDLDTIHDERGFFARAWCAREFEAQGLTSRFVGINTQHNPRKGTLRGLHMQQAPYSEGKFVRCAKGAIFDVIVDLRRDSESYKRWLGVELTSENRKALYAPEGCAHGYLTLEDETEIYYLVSEFYTPGSERGIRWNDPAFNIGWPIKTGLLISDKDRNWSDFTA
jgi:dTDP-4-dehydrorhamnose 3,5-epimerase